MVKKADGGKKTGWAKNTSEAKKTGSRIVQSAAKPGTVPRSTVRKAVEGTKREGNSRRAERA